MSDEEVIQAAREQGYEGSDDEVLQAVADDYNAAMLELGFSEDDLVRL